MHRVHGDGCCGESVEMHSLLTPAQANVSKVMAISDKADSGLQDSQCFIRDTVP